MFGFNMEKSQITVFSASSNLLPFMGVRQTQGVDFHVKFIVPAVCQALGEALGVHC